MNVPAGNGALSWIVFSAAGVRQRSEETAGGKRQTEERHRAAQSSAARKTEETHR